ncbi:acetyltransferase [Sphaerochaeta pleomorpha str. Grapes]|uniref:Acetyltransferase n=1 Tax=Sphaerochaeta pleomorpha (strain ATCC BAA-1885 / DSM 22778 / Grapes) TaxID=158190 RepID=G8QY97_SPHPG|nr:GNAT family N-acetyltransferase [Sphaerochaeta pleomorpha]AEV29662.1 acetyltransferase [Sphaerochaeta pleomorpha str. Grapes]
MVVTANLEGVSLKVLTEAFNAAFGDYHFSQQMSEQQLNENLTRNGYEPNASTGLFDDAKLIGFVLNGIRDNQAYDCGTAIIPAFRGKGYSHLLIEKTLESLHQNYIDSWILEVLSENTRAKELYMKKGFLLLRKFNCYSLTQKLGPPDGSVTLSLENPSLLEKKTDCSPSWQNSNDSVRAGLIGVWSIQSQGEKAGYLCFSKKTGSIAQLFIYPSFRNKGIANEAIKYAQTLSQTKTLKYINIDAAYTPLNRFLTKTGFTLLTTQEELIMDFSGKKE